MKFRAMDFQGAFVIEPEFKRDARGNFFRSFCRRTFAEHGLNPDIMQCSVSTNPLKGTLRGMHYQTAPYPEAKLVRCSRGAIYDVLIDLRPESASFMRWTAVQLKAEEGLLLYIPASFAHGFVTLSDETDVVYQISENYHPESARGIRWNDPTFGIEWPIADPILSEQDRSYPDWQREVVR